jgi:hypothetical protein
MSLFSDRFCLPFHISALYIMKGMRVNRYLLSLSLWRKKHTLAKGACIGEKTHGRKKHTPAKPVHYSQ